MKVYVDGEMPKNCFECPCFCGDSYFPCGLSDGTNDYFLDEIDGGECPLQSLADYTKQVRKEVCQEIRKKMTHWEDCLTKEVTEYVIDKETLDQIEQGETK